MITWYLTGMAILLVGLYVNDGIIVPRTVTDWAILLCLSFLGPLNIFPVLIVTRESKECK